MSSESGRHGGLRARIGRLLHRGGGAQRLPAVDDADLQVVAASEDDSAASSTVLAAAGFASTHPVVLRHVLAVADAAASDAIASAALDGYVEVDVTADDPVAAPLVTLALARVQRVDARTLSQERSRMASVASRCGGRILGWSLLDVPAPPEQARR